MALPRIINIPRTRTILALGVLSAAVWFNDGIDWNNLLFLIVGAYFGDRLARPEPTRSETAS
jgi:hypothetical protein